MGKVEEMVEDLATVVRAFDSPMVVEGCTGGTGSDYWQQLAQNRANKIVSMMLCHGCSVDKVFPLGTPGGGAFWGRHAERNLSSDLPAALPCERAVGWLGCRTRLNADEPQLRRVCTIVVFDSICSMRPDPR